MKNFCSMGGLGDCWIAFLKILEMDKRGIQWVHLTGQEFHVKSIQELMDLMPFAKSTKCIFSPKVQRENDLLNFPEATRIDSRAHGIKNPIIEPPNDLTDSKLSSLNYAVVQPFAGRDDNSFRFFSKEVVQGLVDKFATNGLSTVLLGTECNYRIKGARDYTGKTNVSQCISILSASKHTVALDGFVAYVSMSLGRKTSVIFHEPQLYYHYMHDKWKSHTNAIVGSQEIKDKNYINLIFNKGIL